MMSIFSLSTRLVPLVFAPSVVIASTHPSESVSSAYQHNQDQLGLSSNSLDGHGKFVVFIAIILFIWYFAIVSISLLGAVVVRIRHFAKPPNLFLNSNTAAHSNTSHASFSNSRSSQNDVEGVTILRPLKGIDTEMQYCLVSSFVQEYPKFELIFCVESSHDPCIPIVKSLIEKYPDVDAKLLIDPDDNEGAHHYGPNPKINNLAKGYLQAKYDIIWVLDSNVWVPPGAMGRSVAAFQERGRGGHKIKLVHHLPLCVSLDNTMSKSWGSKLDEMFLLTSHSKFYTAINAVAIAPCVTGKSNLYRRSDLDAAVQMKLQEQHENLVQKKYNSNGSIINKYIHRVDSTWSASSSSTSLNQYPTQSLQPTSSNEGLLSPTSRESNVKVAPGTGIRNFSQYIAEDNMIALYLWEYGNGRTYMTSDTVVQPLADVSLTGYWDRRVRWLRVRRYMVSAATYIEPTTESICSGIFGTFALSVLFLSSPEYPRFWSWIYFFFHMITWCCVDYFHFHNLLAFYNIDGINRPYFVSKYFSPYNQVTSCRKRSLATWIPAWVLREVLAFPIWVTAMCGQTIYWRNRPFRILNDLSTEEILD